MIDEKLSELEKHKFYLFMGELKEYVNIFGNTPTHIIEFLVAHIVKLQIKVDELENKECTCSHTTVYGSGSGVCK